MNERMTELYKEACEFAYGVCKKEGRPGGPSDHIWHTLSTGRFAELIVKECADVAQLNTPDTEECEYTHLVSEKIREHFGVE